MKTPLLGCAAVAAMLYGCAPATPAALELEVRGGLDLDAGMAQGEALSAALVALDGKTQSIRFVLPGYADEAGRPAWPLATDDGPVQCLRDGRVAFQGERLNLNVQPYHHLLVSIESAPAATLTCVRSGETGTLRLEGRFAVAVTEIPTANSVVLTAVAGD